MPTGPGGLDPNGVWQYGEDDTEALASDLLNLGMASVSTALAAIVTGQILQVVSTTKTDTFTANVATGAFVAVTGLTATITPSATSSKVFVMLNVSGSSDVGHGIITARLTRGGTPISVGDAAGVRAQTTAGQTGGRSGNDSGLATVSANFLDPPSTVSSVTYGVDIHNLESTTVALNVNFAEDDANSASRQRSTSTITLWEVAG